MRLFLLFFFVFLLQRPLLSAVIEGNIVATSHLPDPVSAAYPDCLRAIKVQVTGAGEIRVPEYILLMVPGFSGRDLTTGALLQPGDRVRAEELLPWDEAPEAVKVQPQADDIDDWTLLVYYTAELSEVAEFDPVLTANFLPEPVEAEEDSPTEKLPAPPQAPALAIPALNDNAHSFHAFVWEEKLIPVLLRRLKNKNKLPF